MIDKLDGALRVHQLALGLRAERQQVLANNIANADTPSFKARDFDFAAELSKAAQGGQGLVGGQGLRTTDARHLSARLEGLASERELLYRMPAQPSMDGNTVDMDFERGQFADNAVRYQTSLTLMNSRIQGLKSALQPE
ncbi:Flagellar basal body rod protein FlgB [compost metagenome]